MNIFVLHTDPWKAAKMHCDQHVWKMPVEVAQMLNTNSILLGGGSYDRGFPLGLYKLSHKNHPCTIWARQTYSNFEWLVEYGLALCIEYTERRGKVIASMAAIEWAATLGSRPTKGNLTEFANCTSMLDESLRTGDVVTDYRRLYNHVKSKFAKWESGVLPPSWYRPNRHLI